jgi:hypothetical protein
VPIKIISEANNREHWYKKWRRKTDQQAEIFAVMHNLLLGKAFDFPVHVELKRIGQNLLDSDNLANAFKGIQDAVAKKLGVDDGDRERVSWSYEQEASHKHFYEVSITITKKLEEQHGSKILR